MDNYLASGNLNDANEFILNINFEILKGCPYQCPGCFVNKEEDKIISKENTEKVFTLLDSANESSYKNFIAFIGPTDFLVSSNTIEVLTHPDIIEILNEFQRLSFQTTYLNINDMGPIIETLNTHYQNCEVEFNLVIDPAKISDSKYLNILDKNKNKFLAALNRPDARSFGIMNVYDYDKTKIANLLKNYHFMHKSVEHLFETTIDYNFSIGRKPDLTSQEFQTATNRIKALFNHSTVSAEKAEYLRFSFGKLTDSLIEKQYNYLNGNLYASPLLYERFASFNENFKIPTKSFHIKEVELYENSIISKQFLYASKTKECADCSFLGSCVDRGILFLMETYNIVNCLVAKDALETLNYKQEPENKTVS
jgi:hypothetical protein